MAKRPKPATIPQYKRRRQRGFGARVFMFLVKLVLIFLVGSVLWVLLYRFVPPPITATMLGDVFAGRGATRDWMSIGEIDRDMVRAAIAAEDSKFCQHNGFDFEAIEDAMKRNASGGRIRGGSTISQQTAKNAFLWQGGGYARKGAEAYFTFLIERLWGKRRIMEVYLNVAETGIGTYGANAGAQRYFDHDASALSPTEAARIAAVLPLPKKRGAVAPKGFTRRYGNTISARIGQVRRDGLDACVYQGATAPKDRTSPPSKAPSELPGSEYETANPPPPVATVDEPTFDEPTSALDVNSLQEAPPPTNPDEPGTSPLPDDSTTETPPEQPPG